MMHQFTSPDGRPIQCFRAAIPVSLLDGRGNTVKIDTNIWAVMDGDRITPMCHEQFLVEFGDIAQQSGIPKETLYNG